MQLMSSCLYVLIIKRKDFMRNAPSHELFGLVKVGRTDEENLPISYEDYTVEVEEDNLTDGVSVKRMV